MKLAEFLNDDTCQILLAIIVGIVVCYFIFGSCGSCSTGSCNRDGFSVGGQSCTGGMTQEGRLCEDMGETACRRNAVDCTWDPGPTAPPPTPSTSANIGCRVIGQNGIPYLTELTNQCQLGQNTDGTLERGATVIDNYNLDGSIDSTFRYSQRCCDLVQNIPPECQANGTELDTILGPDGVSLRNDLSTINTHFCTRQPTGGNSSPPPPTANSSSSPPSANSPPPPPPSANSGTGTANSGTGTANSGTGTQSPEYRKYSNILSSISHTLDTLTNTQNLPIDDDAHGISQTLDQIQNSNYIPPSDYYMFNGLFIISIHERSVIRDILRNPIPNKENFNRLKLISDRLGIYFHICQNLESNIIGSDILGGVNITYQDGEYININANNQLQLGDLFGAFSLASLETKKEIYCNSNTIMVSDTSNLDGTPQEKYDPLLKMKSLDMVDDLINLTVQCNSSNSNLHFDSKCNGSISGNDVFDCDFSIGNNNRNDYVNVGSKPVEDVIKNMVDSHRVSSANRFINNYNLWFKSSAYSQSVNKRSSYEIFIKDNVKDDENKFNIMSRLSIPVNIQNITSIIYSDNSSNLATNIITDNTIDFNTSNGSYHLVKVYGMSQGLNGSIHPELDPDNDVYTRSENKKVFFKMLIFVQYLITRLFLVGTDKYISPELNIYNNSFLIYII